MKFIIFSSVLFVTYAHILDLDSFEVDDLLCSKNNFQCNVKAYRPCCDPDYKCTKLGRGAASRTFRCLKSSAKLKESCHRDIDCYTIDFAGCKNGKCKCQDNFTAMGEIKCVPLLGGFCFKNDDCIIQNSSCVDNKCQCKKNFIALKENKCTELTLGKSCQSHEDCSEVSNSKCYEIGKCYCKEGYESIGTSHCQKADKQMLFR